MNEAHRPQDKKLGRGLSALLGDNKSKPNMPSVGFAPISDKGISIDSIDLNKLVAGVYQPRRNFNHDDLEELANSIKENGILQPIIVRRGDEDDHFEIIAGERRYRAAKLAGLKKIPAIVKKINNHEALELAIIENVQRSDLSLIEEAQGYKQLMEEFSYSQEQVAKKTGKSRAHIANILRLLNLPATVKNYLEQKQLSMGHARAIINSKDPESLAKKIIENSLTVRDVEDAVRDERIEEMQNSPVSMRRESKVKFVNSGQLTDLENEIAGILETEVKIHFNQFKNTGKITINFESIDEVKALVRRLK